MFLRNYAEYQRALGISQPNTATSGQSASLPLTSLKNLTDSTENHYLAGVNGTNNFMAASYWLDALRKAWDVFNFVRMAVGTGTTEADPDDYCLEDDTTSNFTSVSLSKSFGLSEDGHFTLIFSWTGTNATQNDIVVSEAGIVKTLGMFANATISSSASGIVNDDFLIARMILPNPVTIGAGNSGTVIIKIEMF